MNNPAPINNKNETANCRTSSPLLKRETAMLVPRPCLRAVVKSRLVARQAGIDPKRRPVNTEINTAREESGLFFSQSQQHTLAPESEQHSHNASECCEQQALSK